MHIHGRVMNLCRENESTQYNFSITRQMEINGTVKESGKGLLKNIRVSENWFAAELTKTRKRKAAKKLTSITSAHIPANHTGDIER